MAAQSSSHDAIIVGAGHNGLVTGIYLAQAGWNPLVVERNAEVGGAIRSDELTESGFVHDTYSTNQNLFMGSQVYADSAEELATHGLKFEFTSTPFCNVFPDGTSLRVYADEKRTFEELRNHHQADEAGWKELYGKFGRFVTTLLPVYDEALPSAGAARVLAKALREEGPSGVAELGQVVLNSPRELADTYLQTEEAKVLIASWGLHLDFGPDVSGGAMIPFIETFSAMGEGMAICKGGASNLSNALARLCEEFGGEVRTDAEVSRVIVRSGRAVGVEFASGERYGARRAVVANLSPSVLFERLIDDAALDDEVRSLAEGFEHGPGTMMIHLSMDELPPWEAGEDLNEFMYVHIAPYVSDLAETYTDALNGRIPESPLTVVGQTTAVDPSRTPNDEHILWIQVRALPAEIEGDAADEISATNWAGANEAVADRVLDKVERYAPGFRDLIRERVVLGPNDLEASNPNLVGGDNNGGSHHLRQNFLWRPFPGYSRYEMPIDGLYMVGAGTWPGGGNNATSGYLGAQQILEPDLRHRATTTARSVLRGVTGSVI